MDNNSMARHSAITDMISKARVEIGYSANTIDADIYNSLRKTFKKYNR